MPPPPIMRTSKTSPLCKAFICSVRDGNVLLRFGGLCASREAF